MDGDGENISTNGTWIISNDYSDIANNMIVRVGAIQIKTIYNQYNKRKNSLNER